MEKYTVAAFKFGKLLKDEKGIKDYGSAIMLGNIWRREGVDTSAIGNTLQRVQPEEIMVFSVDKSGAYTVVRTWDELKGGAL